MTKDEALKLALRALERLACLGNGVMRGNSIGNQIAIDALTAIKEALAQPERSMKVEGPLHVVCQCDKCKAQPEQPKVRTGNCLRVGVCASEGHKIAPQRTWVGLTKNEVEILAYKAEGNTWKAVELAEAKLKEKNAP